MHRRTDRTASGRFLVEGPRAAAEALAEHGRTGGGMRDLFITEAARARYPHLVTEAGRHDVAVHDVADSVAEALSSTRTPQGVVAVCDIPQHTLDQALVSSTRLVTVLVDVADPGNAGTAIRTADAAGADCVVLTGTAVDAYNGKCVRATAGSLFHLPVITGIDVDAAVIALRRAGLTIRAADPHGDVDLDDLENAGELVPPTAWLFGNEARGLGDTSDVLADEVVRIPLRGRAESLNLAAAAAVCLFASARAQRRAAGRS